MRFNDHSRLSGLHAFLSPSNASWLNYDDHKLAARVTAHVAAARGTALHKLAQDLIKLGVKLPDTTQTLNAYVNDALGYRMVPEQILFYSENCYGTADTISFRQHKLRIHDLKNGLIRAKMAQLEIYAALFCLEYNVNPFEIEIELRIYQNDEVDIHAPDAHFIMSVMDKIVYADKFINALRREVDA